MRVWILIVGVSLGLSGTSLASPQDSPGTVYIDGVPCNVACQSYMAWSRQTLKANQPTAARPANASTAAPKSADRKRISKRVEPATANARSGSKSHDLQAAMTATRELPLPKPRAAIAPLNAETSPPAAPATAAEPPPVPQSKAENVPLNAEANVRSKERSPQELVTAALAVAEQLTSASSLKALDADSANETKVGDTDPSSSRDIGALVAILIARPDVKSAAELKGMTVAIDATESRAQRDIGVALAAAGATEVQLSVSDASPIDRIVGDDVQAAVVILVSPDAAEAFPDIKGFKVLRVPLSPR
jgi:hypothetical protein